MHYCLRIATWSTRNSKTLLLFSLRQHFAPLNSRLMSYFSTSPNSPCICASRNRPSLVIGISGRGKWKEIASNIPSRSTVQTKTHAICFIKRIEAGEDVFSFSSKQDCSANQLDSDDKPTFSSIPDCMLRKYKKLSKEEQGLVILLGALRNSNNSLIT